MTTLREAAEASLDALKEMRQKYGEYDCRACDHADVAIIKLCAALEEPEQEPVAASLKRGTTGRCTRKVCECEKEGLGLECIHLEPVVDGYPLWSGIPKAEPVPLPVPPEVAATLTTADIAWLATYRLTRLWTELGQMRWVGVDKGWDLAIEAVRRRLDAECQDVLAWKARADQSGATAVELLQKMQRL